MTSFSSSTIPVIEDLTVPDLQFVLDSLSNIPMRVRDDLSLSSKLQIAHLTSDGDFPDAVTQNLQRMYDVLVKHRKYAISFLLNFSPSPSPSPSPSSSPSSHWVSLTIREDFSAVACDPTGENPCNILEFAKRVTLYFRSIMDEEPLDKEDLAGVICEAEWESVA